MKTLKTISLTLLALMIAGNAFSQTRFSGQKRMNHSRHDYMFSQLDLSQEQQEQVSQIRLETRKAMTSLNNQLREKRAKLQTLTTGDDADFTAAEKTVDEITALQARKMKQRLQSRQQVRNLLTDEQKVKFDSRHRSGNCGNRGHARGMRMQRQ